MSFVANGLELAPGSEVLTSDREHIGGVSAWELLAARRGVSLRHVQLPAPGAPADEIIARFEREISPRTRVVSLSHVLFTNGAVMPVREIADLCRGRGIISVIDGAHPPGMMRVDLRAIGADFYATSPHKWLCAAQGSGLLYIAEPWRERLWPTLASGGWNDRALGAHRLNHMGTMDESRLAGLGAAVAFQQAIGVDPIEARQRELRHALTNLLQRRPGIRLHSPAESGAGMVSLSVDGVDSAVLQQRLAGADNVRTRLISEHGLGWLRLSPHIYNTVEELEQVASLI
jgi:selenocysteine lyase/cysteine desulfurase